MNPDEDSSSDDSFDSDDAVLGEKFILNLFRMAISRLLSSIDNE